MRLKSHKIDAAPYQPAKAIGGAITPTLVVVHDTASRLDEGSAARYLRDNPARVSVHFVVERDGSLIQQVPTNRRANHAGTSQYHGRRHCNGFSIGIEIVNPGKMTYDGPGRARTWFKQSFGVEEYGIHRITTPEHGAGYWMDYTPEQIETTLQLCQALFRGIDTLKDIQAHWYISPGRKTDTNPLFPLESLRARVLGREDRAELEPKDDADTGAIRSWVQIETRGSGLNMRRWPSFNPNVLTAIPNGAEVPVLRDGVFSGTEWLCVLYDGQEGWVVRRYTKKTSKPTERS
jgi:N-acetylmuramoyl-L-alanine amidase